MDALTKKARELVIVELRDGDGPWYWDGLTWNGSIEKAQKMERGRAEIFVAQQRRNIPDMRPGSTVQILEIAQPAPRPLSGREQREAMARDVRALLANGGR